MTSLWGGGGDFDTITGSSGGDLLYGGSGGHQRLDGGSGNDTIVAGSGGDTLVGGSGNDLFKVGNAGNDTIDGGSGHDTVRFDDSYANANVSIHHGVATVTFGDTGQTIKTSDVEELVFTDKTIHV